MNIIYINYIYIYKYKYLSLYIYIYIYNIYIYVYIYIYIYIYIKKQIYQSVYQLSGVYQPRHPTEPLKYWAKLLKSEEKIKSYAGCF